MNTLLLLAGVELGAAIVLGRTSWQSATPLPGEVSPYYREKPWAIAYWREFHAIRHAYHPYFLWRARPFRGQLIKSARLACAQLGEPDVPAAPIR